MFSAKSWSMSMCLNASNASDLVGRGPLPVRRRYPAGCECSRRRVKNCRRAKSTLSYRIVIKAPISVSFKGPADAEHRSAAQGGPWTCYRSEIWLKLTRAKESRLLVMMQNGSTWVNMGRLILISLANTVP